MANMETVVLTGTTRSTPIRLVDKTILRIWFPATWDTANLGVEEAEADDKVFGPTHDDEGGQYLIVGAAGRMVRVRGTNFQHARWVRFYSTNAQLAPRTLRMQVVLLRELIMASD